MPPPAIPDRWIPYKACGEVIEGTRFICFKVPLKRSVQSNVREIVKIWDIPTLLEEIPKLGAVIDLTYTTRYYNPQDFLKANVLHRKILVPGRIIPPESSVEEFMNAADEFLGKGSDSLVGVHCTHGLNRTGYMVCRYMRDRLGIPAQEAITKFEVARGYKMEREIYINDLLGAHGTPLSVGKETEVIPIERRRNDVNYRSPLAYDRDSPPVDSSKRFGYGKWHNDIKETEVIPVESRRNDLNYRSPLADDRVSPPVDSSKRFGNNRSYNDRHGYNQNVPRTENSSGSKNDFFSCYTNRYNNEKKSDSRSRRDRDRRSDGSPLSWRKKEESSGDNSSRRSRNDDKSGYNRNRRDERSGRSRDDK